MPITISAPPPGSLEAIRDAVSDLRGTASLDGTPSAAGGQPDFSASAPHPVYFLGLDQVVSGAGLSEATQSGWRFLLLDGSAVRAAITVEVGADGGARFSHMNRGPYVSATVEGLAAAEQRAELSVADFALRLLEIPGIKIIALWLHGPEDYLLALPPAPPELSTSELYRESEFFDALRARAGRQYSPDARG